MSKDPLFEMQDGLRAQLAALGDNATPDEVKAIQAQCAIIGHVDLLAIKKLGPPIRVCLICGLRCA